MAISEKLEKKRTMLLVSSLFASSCIGERIDISVEHEAIKYGMSPSSLRLFILHVANGPLIRSPSTMKPPPNKSACLVIEILLLFFTNTLAHFAASVAQAPSNSNARELELSSTKIVQESIRAISRGIPVKYAAGSLGQTTPHDEYFYGSPSPPAICPRLFG
jgi:hypothetical protein